MTFLKKEKQHLGAYFCFFCFTVYFTLTTAYFPFSARHLGFDQGVFSYVGLAMSRGLVPYLQAWDNKGPLLYFINMAAQLLHYEYGMFPIEMVTLFFTMALLYKGALLLTANKPLAATSAVFPMMLLSICLQGGNMSEEFSLPFLALIMYYAVRFYVQGHTLGRLPMFWVGISVGAVFLLRVNNLAFPVAIALTMIYTLCKAKRWIMLGRVILWVAVGFACMVAPFFVYLAAHGALWAYAQAALFTLSSFTHPGKLQSLKNIHDMLVGANITGLLPVSIVFLVLLPAWGIARRRLPERLHYPLWFCFWGMLLNLALNSLSGYGFYHYCMTFIPILALPLAWMLCGVYQALHKLTASSLKSAALLIAAVFFLSFDSFTYTTDFIIGNVRERNGPYNSMPYLTDYILSATEETDRIQLIGKSAAPAMYYHTKRLAASKYFYTEIPAFTPELVQEAQEDVAASILREKPKLILFAKENERDAFVQSVEEGLGMAEYLARHYQQQENVPNYYIAYLRR